MFAVLEAMEIHVFFLSFSNIPTAMESTSGFIDGGRCVESESKIYYGGLDRFGEHQTSYYKK